VENTNRDNRGNALRPRIYISGPITRGDREANFQQAADAQKRLIAAGFAVLNPMLTMRLPGAFEIDHDTWIANDLPWVAVADAVLRLPGKSKGADIECEHALIHGVPVFYDEAELKRFFCELQRGAKQNAR
jgi:hypothetical protein